MSDREEVVAIILGALYRDRVTGFTGRAVQIQARSTFQGR